MKNREKYTNTDEAMKAFENHNKHCNCGCTFEQWLDKEYLNADELCSAILGLAFCATLRDVFDLHKDKSAKDGKSATDDASGKDSVGVECPVCHSKNGKLNGVFMPSFECEDCGVFIGRKKDPDISPSEFKEFLAGLCKMNVKA